MSIEFSLTQVFNFHPTREINPDSKNPGLLDCFCYAAPYINYNVCECGTVHHDMLEAAGGRVAV